MTDDGLVFSPVIRQMTDLYKQADRAAQKFLTLRRLTEREAAHGVALARDLSFRFDTVRAYLADDDLDGGEES
ncbi:MAG: hypothetical protein WBB00_07885 [Mycobacterium sp.]